jgi:hypothetical protein
MTVLDFKVVKLKRKRHQQDSLASFHLSLTKLYLMAAPLCLTLKIKHGVQPKLIMKEHILKVTGVIAMKPVHLISMEQVNELLFSLNKVK